MVAWRNVPAPLPASGRRAAASRPACQIHVRPWANPWCDGNRRASSAPAVPMPTPTAATTTSAASASRGARSGREALLGRRRWSKAQTGPETRTMATTIAIPQPDGLCPPRVPAPDGGVDEQARDAGEPERRHERRPRRDRRHDRHGGDEDGERDGQAAPVEREHAGRDGEPRGAESHARAPPRRAAPGARRPGRARAPAGSRTGPPGASRRRGARRRRSRTRLRTRARARRS